MKSSPTLGKCYDCRMPKNQPQRQTIELSQDPALSIATTYRQTSGHLITFLHGLGCARTCFDSAFAAPELTGYSLLSFDWLGHGDSDKPNDFSYSMADQAAVGMSVLKHFESDKLSLVAHSMGGAIGLLMAPHVRNLDTFISVEGNLVAEDAGIVSRRTASQSPHDFEDHGYADFWQTLEQSGRKDLEAWADWYGQAGKLALHSSAISLVNWSDSGELLDSFNRLPRATYIHGDEEPKDYLLPRLHNANVIAMRNTGHFMMVDDPQGFYQHVAAAIAA